MISSVCFRSFGFNRFSIAFALALTTTALAASSPSVATCAEPSETKPAAANNSDEASPRISVLFLGDRGHHEPAKRAAQLMPVLADRGIDVTYTEDTADLNDKTLAKYDALIIYANTDRIEADQDEALFNFVVRGGGLVPLHCASYCFRNSSRYVALVGGRFKSHGTGEFETVVTAADHPIMKDLTPFRTWDETYVHHLHNERDRQVLQTRKEGARDEPWTWVRSEGRGRVFYTAYGHDARTFSHPGFHALVERGIRWASRKGEVFDSQPQKRGDTKPFEYTQAKLPNYLPKGGQAEPLGPMQHPLPPTESVKHMVLPRNFTPQLFASEPDIAKPLCMAWDHRGRLWIAETVDYPNELQPEGKGGDRIKICEDTNGDGLADKFTVFAERLSIPTSLLFSRGGLIVHQAPHTLFLKDTDGDDQADTREVLFTGWSPRDTHAGPSNLVYGFDNWIYGMVGYSGFKGAIGGENHEFRQGFYRFRPDGSKLEFIRSTNNNSWGVGFNEEGVLFGSTANGTPSVYMPIANRYYERVRGWSSSVLSSMALSNKFYPVTDKVRQVDHHGGFTAAAGHALYTARAYPKTYWNRAAFVAEPTGHLAATFLIEPRGSDFFSYNSWNLLASYDEWTSPTMAEVGPDGQVWMIDWYNFIVQHNPTPHGFSTGKGGAYETDLRDKKHGRIYRLVYDGAKVNGGSKGEAKAEKATASKQSITALDPKNAQQLVDALKSDNLFWRRHAQRLLVERGRDDVVPQLIKLIDNPEVDELGLNTAAIHALWTLHGLGAMSDTQATAKIAVIAALRHPSAGVRRNAIQVLPLTDSSTQALLKADLPNDRDAQVRLAAFLALADLPASDASAESIIAALPEPNNSTDRWIPDAATAAAAKCDRAFLTALTKGKTANSKSTKLDPRLAEIAGRVAQHHARGIPTDTIGALLIALADGDAAVADAVIPGLLLGWPKDRIAKVDPATDKALTQLLTKVSPETKSYLITLATRLGSDAMQRYSAEIAGVLREVIKDASKSDRVRLDAARELIDFQKTEASTAAELLALISPRTSTELSIGLIECVGKSEANEVGAAIIDALGNLTPAVRPTAIRTLLTRSTWTAAMLTGVEQGKLRLAELSLDQKQALAAHPEKAIATRANKLLASGGGLPDKNRQKVIDELSALVLTKGDVVKGKEVYKQQCAKCHIHSGEGTKVGPDLTGMAVHPKQELLIHILDPSRSVEGNYVQYSLLSDEGLVINGLMASETKTAVELIDAEGKKHTVQRDTIDTLTASTKSLMPEGFEKQVPAAAIADLLEFLTQRGKYLPLDLRKVASINSTQGMFYSKDAQAERLIFDDWSPKVFEGVPFQLLDPQGDRANNVLLMYGPGGAFPPKMPKNVTLDCNMPAKAIHLLSGVSGWGYSGAVGKSADRKPTVSLIVRLHYVDGKPEDHPLQDGVHFADYIRQIDVPESKLAFKLRGQQIRYLAIQPKRTDTIARIEFVKGPDNTAPIVMAVTVEGREP